MIITLNPLPRKTNEQIMGLPIVKTAIIKVLEQAISKIKSGWTQKADYRDKDSKQLEVHSKNVAFYSISGAIRSSTSNYRLILLTNKVIKEAIRTLYPDMGFYIIDEWNDSASTTSERVLRVLEFARKSFI